jgi:hypothetical protein
VNRSPAFERFVFSGSPIRKFRVDHDIRFKVKGESGLILKPDVDEEIFWGNVQFDALDNFASGLREGQNTPVALLFGTLRDSHESPFVRRGFVVRDVPSVHALARPVLFIPKSQSECKGKRTETGRKIAAIALLCLVYCYPKE